MKASRANKTAAGQTPAVQHQRPRPVCLTAVDFVPLGDGTFKAVPRKPVELASVALAGKLTGVKRDVIYRLYRAGFIEGSQPSPRKIVIYLASLHAHIEAAKDDEFWTEDRKQRFNTGCRY